MKSTYFAYLQLMRMDRPIGTFLLLWPTLWALWLAGHGDPDSDIVVIFIVGTFLMRAAGCVINDFADRNFDHQVARTQNRPMATGKISSRSALSLFAVLLLLAFALVLLLNGQTIALAFGGVAIAVFYPFVKRFSNLPQFVLGLAFSWGIPMAYTALTGVLPIEAWVVFLANFLWTVAYDTQYAMVDREDDLRIGIKSSAILFGQHDRLIIGLLQIACLLIWAWAGQVFELGLPYWLSLLGVAGLFGYHQHLIRERDRDACFHAFLHNNRVGLLLFLGVALSYAL